MKTQMSVVKAIHITRLGGFTGSNPEILAVYPRNLNQTLSEKSIIDQFLINFFKKDKKNVTEDSQKTKIEVESK